MPQASSLARPSVGSMCMSKSLVEMASEIVAAQARQAPMSHEEISAGVKKVFAMLQQLQALEAGMSGTSESEGTGKLIATGFHPAQSRDLPGVS